MSNPRKTFQKNFNGRGWGIVTYHDGYKYIEYGFRDERLWKKCVGELLAQGYVEEMP